MIYKTIVHLHSTLATLILLFLLIRLSCKLINPNLLNKIWIKVPAHLFDGLVILLGVTLLHLNNWNFHAWLVLKLVAIVVYILATFYALKKANKVVEVILFGLLAVGSILLIMGLAYSKSIFFL